MSRKRTGEKIQWRARMRTWVGRVRMEDGKRSPWIDLCTDDPVLAQRRYDLWLETGEAPSQAGKELMRKAAERIMEAMAARGEAGIGDRRTRVRQYALPVLGDIEVARIEAHHVASVLDSMSAQGKGSGYILKMRSDISRILSTLRREGAVPHNVALGVELPEDATVDDRPRVVLSDEEVLRFRRRGFDSELDMMALFARDLGGHRTSDLHAADWEDFDTVGWRWCKVRRPKTDGERGRDLSKRRARERAGKRRATRAYEKVMHGIPDTVKGPLVAWWKKHGEPTAGPVFPIRKGPRVGQRKVGKGISYAEPLRDALWAEGIVRPLPGYDEAVGDARRNFCALQVATEETLPVDFHSFRRAYVTAVSNAGANMATVLDLAGHTQESTSHRYRGPRLIETPAAALPGNGGPQQSPISPTPATGQPGSNVGSGAPTPDMAAVAAALAQLAGVLGAQQNPSVPTIDPGSGSKEGVTKLRGIMGGKR